MARNKRIQKSVHLYFPDRGRGNACICGQPLERYSRTAAGGRGELIKTLTTTNLDEATCRRCVQIETDRLAYLAASARRKNEADFQREVTRLLDAAGFRWYHNPDSRRSAAGFPDIVATDGTTIIFAELKTDEGKLKPEQEEWLADLDAAGAVVHVWRPSSLDAIRAALGIWE